MTLFSQANTKEQSLQLWQLIVTLSLVIAFAEGKNGDSWYWFLETLKNMVVQDV
jgi:hypothetical protein